MARLALCAAIALTIFCGSPEPAEPCGVKLNVKAARIRKPTAAQTDRTPIAVGPAEEQRRKRQDAGGGERGEAVGAGGGETAARTPDEKPVAKSDTPPPKEPTDIGDRREETSGTEADTGSEPAQPDQPPLREERPAKFTKRLFFANASANLSSASKAKLRRNAEWMKQNPDKSITVEGHANTLGNPDSNQSLSETRANAVKDYLVEQGVDASRINVESHGSQRPEFKPGSSGKNRRVVIQVN